MSTPQITRLSPQKRTLTFIVLAVLAIPYFLPLVWMILTSLKGDVQIYPQGNSSPLAIQNFLPHPIMWSNYDKVMHTIPLGLYIANTLFLCVVNVIGSVFSSAIIAYGFARIKFRGRDVLFIVMLAMMAIPDQTTMIPRFILFQKLGWYNTFLPLIVPAFFGAPFFIFLFRQFFMSLPEELSESARIEGASEWQIFWKLILPLSKPAIAVCALFAFLGTWNDFLNPLLYLSDPNKYTIAYGLQQFSSEHMTLYAQLMAATTIFTVPIILLFFLTQRTFIQGIATTGGKGG